MSDHIKKVTSTNPYVYLANNGPSTLTELPNHPTVFDRQSGVNKFSLKGQLHGSGAKGDGRKTPIYYIDGKHSPRAVVKKWVAENQKSVDHLSGWTLHQRAEPEFREAIKDIVGFDREFHPGGGTTDKPCPFCGAEIDQLPTHLPECGER